MKKIISFFQVLFLILAQSFVQAQTPSNKGFPDGWDVSTIGGWDATKAPTANQANPNNILPVAQQVIAFGIWNKTSAKIGEVVTSKFSLDAEKKVDIDVAYNEYYAKYVTFSIYLSVGNGSWISVWKSTSPIGGSTNWRWKTIPLTLPKSDNLRMSFEYNGPIEGDLVAFDLGKFLALGLFTTTPVTTNTAPVITLTGANPLYINSVSQLNFEPGYTAIDKEDGNLTNKVQITTNLVTPGNGTFYRAYSVKDAGGLVDTKTRILIVSGLTNVNDESLPTKYLLANYPNPFNPTTTIYYELPEAVAVKIDVLNLLGQNVVTLVNEFKSAGQHKVKFTASNTSSGMYINQLTAGTKILRQKMILLR